MNIEIGQDLSKYLGDISLVEYIGWIHLHLLDVIYQAKGPQIYQLFFFFFFFDKA